MNQFYSQFPGDENENISLWAVTPFMFNSDFKFVKSKIKRVDRIVEKLLIEIQKCVEMSLLMCVSMLV